jgi:hypothetical protein
MQEACGALPLQAINKINIIFFAKTLLSISAMNNVGFDTVAIS